MKFLIYILVFLIILSCEVQKSASLQTLSNDVNNANKQAEALTETENMKRLELFEGDTLLAVKLEAIKKEIRSNILYTYPPKLMIKPSHPQTAIITCKIVFRLGIEGNFYSLDSQWNSNIDKRLNLLTTKNIDSITVFQGNAATAIYGINGYCGVVVLHSSNRKLKREMKRL